MFQYRYCWQAEQSEIRHLCKGDLFFDGAGQARAALQQERVICGAIDNLMLRPAVDLSGTQRAPHIHHGAIQRDLEENKALSCSLWLWLWQAGVKCFETNVRQMTELYVSNAFWHAWYKFNFFATQWWWWCLWRCHCGWRFADCATPVYFPVTAHFTDRGQVMQQKKME